MSINNIPDELLARYFSGELGSIEKKEVEEWLNDSDENKELFEQYKKVWLFTENAEAPDFNSDKAWLKIKLRMQEDESTSSPKIIPLNKPNRFFSLAAGLAIVLGMGSLLFYLNSESNTKTFAAQSESIEVYLPDSSRIILEPYSKLIISDESYNKENRTSSLSGVAYFDVKQNPNKPFIVTSTISQVEALGTSFKISAIPQRSENKVSVITGKVMLTSIGDENNKAILYPGDVGLIKAKSKKTIEVSKQEIEELRYQLNKTIIFEETDLSKVTTILSRIFTVKIYLQSTEIEKCLLTATFKEQKLTEILEIISSTFNLDLKQTKYGFELNGNGCY